MPFDATPQIENPRPDFFAIAREIVASQVAARASHPPVGLCWSGMPRAAPPEIETVEAVAARLQREAANREAFFTAPRGRFLRAVNSLGALGYNEAGALLNIYGRTLANEDEAFGPRHYDAIGRAIRILNEIGHSHAREAVGALADLLSPPLARAA
jgi:hypothetical protein